VTWTGNNKLVFLSLFIIFHNEKLIGTFYEFDTTATYVTYLSELKSYDFCNLRLHMCYPLKSVSSVHNVIEPFCKVVDYYQFSQASG